jgi:cytochrome d ubiquinol oxidase subunit II
MDLTLAPVLFLHFLGGNEKERGIIYQAIGPFWDGNEV